MEQLILKDHSRSLELWESGILKNRILASLLDDPLLVTEDQMEAWVRDFDRPFLGDYVCRHLFYQTSLAYNKAVEWSYQGLELVKRSGFIMMATLAMKDREAHDSKFYPFFGRIRDEAEDERRLVRNAIHFALLQIGYRNHPLHQQARRTAQKMQHSLSPSARWIAHHAMSELSRKEPFL